MNIVISILVCGTFFLTTILVLLMRDTIALSELLDNWVFFWVAAMKLLSYALALATTLTIAGLTSWQFWVILISLLLLDFSSSREALNYYEDRG